MGNSGFFRVLVASSLAGASATLVAQSPGQDSVRRTHLTDTATYYSAASVETSAALDIAHSARPEYPRDLAEAHIAGSVHARFVVDTTGQADLATLQMRVSVDVSRLPPVTGIVTDSAANTRQITEASKQLFAKAVREALPKMHFTPATVATHPVRQLVEEQFNFTAR